VARVRADVAADRAADELAARWRRGLVHVPAWQPPPAPEWHPPERQAVYRLLADILAAPRPAGWSLRCCGGPFVFAEAAGWYRACHAIGCRDRWQPTVSNAWVDVAGGSPQQALLARVSRPNQPPTAG